MKRSYRYVLFPIDRHFVLPVVCLLGHQRRGIFGLYPAD